MHTPHTPCAHHYYRHSTSRMAWICCGCGHQQRSWMAEAWDAHVDDAIYLANSGTPKEAPAAHYPPGSAGTHDADTSLNEPPTDTTHTRSTPAERSTTPSSDDSLASPGTANGPSGHTTCDTPYSRIRADDATS